MAPSSLWATAALLPLVIPQATALIFELSPHVNKRQTQHHRLAQKAKRAAPVLPATWSYLNCYTDGAQRSLAAATFQSDTMTVDQCVAYCENANYLYAGLEYSKECYCDNAIQSGGTVAPSGCDMMCSGDNTQVCGGGNRLNVYKSSKLPPAAIATYNGWGYQGCYTDGAAARTLLVGMGYTAPLTPEKCLDACHAQGYQYAGLEYSAECYCGNEISNEGALAIDASSCAMTCAGDANHICGGGNRLSLYEYGADAVEQPTASNPAASTQTTTSAAATSSAAAAASGWGSKGCWTDDVNLRTLAFGQPGSNTNTPAQCQATCQAGGYKYAGVEYGAECYCANTITAGAGPATDGRCNMACSGDATQICGGGYGLNLYEFGASTDPESSTPSSTSSSAASSASAVQPGTPTQGVVPGYNGWTYMGCFVDSVAARTIPVAMAVTGGPQAMTVELCLDACKSINYPVAGLEYSGECYCGNALPPQITNDGRCNMYCNGAQTEICGGPNGLTTYQYGVVVPSNSASITESASSTSAPESVSSTSAPESVSSTSAPESVSSTSAPESVSSTTAPESVSSTSAPESVSSTSAPESVSSTSAPESVSSTSAPESVGSTSAPESVSSTSAPESASSTSAPESVSSTTVTSSSVIPTATGPSFLQTYGNWESQGCWSDDPGQRSLSFTANTAGANTPQKCMDACYAAGYGFAGMEYAAECYCGTAVINGGSLQTDDGCNMLCQADALHYCGGPYRLNVYKYNGTVPPPTNPPVGGGGGGTGLGPVTTGLPGTWHYDGCYIDGAFGGRIQSFVVGPKATNNAATCIEACAAQGFVLAGMEYSNECYCSNSIQNGGVKAAADTDCAMACAADADHACGGPNRISLYSSVDTFPSYPPPTPKTTNLPGEYKYAGCYMEAGVGQTVFKYQIIDKTENSVEKCANKCAAFGYGAAALEFGDECYCGDASMILPGTEAPAADCNIPCVGSPADICGGAARLTLYTWDMTTNPLYVWDTPANTGHYELLIGGIVIPLIATLGLNNKVTFMEKGGTGAPNSTGAYELDYQLANDYTKAWRVMHVASDVFCAANLVLPDRKGRILSIGGWSLESTEGIRLYTPSGETGVNGTTDWEEHYDQIHLQQGRWYPGAMTMANGSIFVVGGEDGSNGRPVPTIEVLPKPEGGPTYLEMDWLLRTDPNNLYPFSYVLPGGGIFIIYYNEAIVLDEVTFETVKTFPIIPGQVNAAGGRTYPMEGTSMVLPQVAPYTDPLEILTCGGSAFGQAFDNCVSIQPESDDPVWIVERMPSKRVMTIMTALPDGTYIIMGGAQQGVAGFGLAIYPNLQAILYDPSKPRHRRFSILGTTSVARLYHSEAILLHDGRVLVTGSDPEDNGQNPQEYRMEVYLPPYLTSGLIQPTYTIANRDWTYGGSYTITNVNLAQGSTATLRVSLMGAVSTTHGNSFGQRTFFPDVSCAGTTCTIVAPPNSHICPPGWFQLFILDGPTPSNSQWVRIGGDPGALGNWPNYPGFTLPGVGGI